MNNKLLLLFTLLCFYAHGQNDTIEVSRDYKTILIFPENISESIIGNDFTFNVNLPNPEGSKFNLRILKLYYNQLAKEKKDYTNYTVITQNGNSYDFILTLVEKPKKLTWYISAEQAVTNINGGEIIKPDQDLKSSQKEGEQLQLVESQKHLFSKNVQTISSDSLTKKKDTIFGTPKPELYKQDKMRYYEMKCYYMDYGNADIGRYFARNGDVFLWLQGVYYNNNEIYIQFRIENKETVDLDINFINYSIATNYKKSSSNQKVQTQPLFIYNTPKRIKGLSENYFVAVFDKFTLDKHKKLVVDLDELNGNRGISLSIEHSLINNPIRF